MSAAPFFLLSRALAATFGTATVYVVFRLGRRLWDDTTALVAAAFMALALQAFRATNSAGRKALRESLRAALSQASG